MLNYNIQLCFFILSRINIAFLMHSGNVSNNQLSTIMQSLFTRYISAYIHKRHALNSTCDCSGVSKYLKYKMYDAKVL